jgi:hypothetical protein
LHANSFGAGKIINQAATLRIEGAPSITGPNITIGLSFGLWVVNSTARFEGGATGFVFMLPTDATAGSATYVPATGRIKVLNDISQTKYIHLHDS